MHAYEHEVNFLFFLAFTQNSMHFIMLFSACREPVRFQYSLNDVTIFVVYLLIPARSPHINCIFVIYLLIVMNQSDFDLKRIGMIVKHLVLTQTQNKSHFSPNKACIVIMTSFHICINGWNCEVFLFLSLYTSVSYLLAYIGYYTWLLFFLCGPPTQYTRFFSLGDDEVK